MHSALNRDGESLQIDGLRIPEVGRCHVLLRQMDALESAVDKHIVLDLATAADLQIMLKQVCIYSVMCLHYTFVFALSGYLCTFFSQQPFIAFVFSYYCSIPSVSK